MEEEEEVGTSRRKYTHYPDGRWLLETRSLLERRTETYENISRATGVGVFWLARFAKGKVCDPSVNRINLLHDYLAEVRRKKMEELAQAEQG